MPHHVSVTFATCEGNGSCTSCRGRGRIKRGQSTWEACPSCLPRPCETCGDEGFFVVREATRNEPEEYQLCTCPAGGAFLRLHHSHSDADVTIRQRIIDDLSSVPF